MGCWPKLKGYLSGLASLKHFGRLLPRMVYVGGVLNPPTTQIVQANNNFNPVLSHVVLYPTRLAKCDSITSL